MMRSFNPWTFLVIVVALSGCPSRTPTPAPPTVGVADDSVVQALWRQRTSGGIKTEPCLGPGDLLEISVFHWADLQGYRTRVSPAGTISLPTLGTMRAAGLTDTELRDQIAAGLRQNVMRD